MRPWRGRRRACNDTLKLGVLQTHALTSGDRIVVSCIRIVYGVSLFYGVRAGKCDDEGVS